MIPGTREWWELNGQPTRVAIRVENDAAVINDIGDYRGKVTSIRYPAGATLDERWAYYKARVAFLSYAATFNGYAWSDPTGRKIGQRANDIEQEIKNRVRREEEAGMMSEFEAEARRLHAERVARLDAMTDEEKAACERFMMPGLLDRYRRLELNQHVPVETVELNIAECVKHYRDDLWQSSPEHDSALRQVVRWPDKGERDAYMASQKEAFLTALAGGGVTDGDRWRDDWKASGTDMPYNDWVHHHAPATITGGNEVCGTCERDFPPGTLRWRPHREDFCQPECTMWTVGKDGGVLTDSELRELYPNDYPPPALRDIITESALENLNKGKWAGTLRIVGPDGDVAYDERGNVIDEPPPSLLPVVGTEKKGRATWITVDGVAVGRARSARDARKIQEALS